MQTSDKTSLREIAGLFLKLGVIGFGGPAAHIAMMEDEVVRRKGWMDRAQFLDLVGATNLIPGPNSTEMAIHIGYIRRGWRGLLLAGVCFILPAAVLTTALAWAYVKFGNLPQVAPLIYGIQPAVLVVILSAVLKLGRSAVKNRQLAIIGTIVLALALLGLNEILALLLGSLIGLIWLSYLSRRVENQIAPAWIGPLVSARLTPFAKIFSPEQLQTEAGPALWQLGLIFLKVGSVLYGSGYVLVAFLEGDLVQKYGWLTQSQLLDAVAIGQFTPGPVLTTATFIGYILLGPAGALVSTIAIFAPSFLFVILLNPVIPRLRQSHWTSGFLDAVNVSAIGLIVAVLLQLSRSTLVDWESWLITVILGFLAFVLRLSSAWLILIGAGLGWILLVIA